MNKIEMKATPEQIELIKLTGHKDRSKAWPAMEAFAATLGPVVLVVLDKLSTVRDIYTIENFAENDNAEYPLDLFFNEKDNDIRVHYQSRPGGTPVSHMQDLQTVIVPTNIFQGEVDWQNKFARFGRLDIIARYIHKLSQAMLRKEELNGWSVILDSLAKGNTNGQAHVTQSTTTDGVLHLDGLNQLLTLSKRINTAIDGGSAANAPQGCTDLYMSIEAMQDVRAMSYNPVNVRGAIVAAPAAGDSSISLPSDMREEILKGGGMPMLMGLTLHEMNEFGLNFAYNVLFKQFYTGSFTQASQEIIVGIDRTRDSAVMPIKGNLEVQNDIFMTRSDRSGVIATIDEGWAVLDNRQVTGLIVR